MKTVILFLSLVIAASGAEQIVLQPPLQPAVFEPVCTITTPSFSCRDTLFSLSLTKCTL